MKFFKKVGILVGAAAVVTGAVVAIGYVIDKKREKELDEEFEDDFEDDLDADFDELFDDSYDVVTDSGNKPAPVENKETTEKLEENVAE